MPVYRSGFSVDHKPDRTPVTEADRAAELALREFFARECPGHSFVGEEFGEAPGDSTYRWIVDPIDGTKSFIHRVPLWGTLIALERDGRPVVGVIACHAAGETAYAAEGLGAFVDGTAIRVSRTPTFAEATVCLTSAGRMHQRWPAAWDAIARSAGLVRTWGDCYGYLMVATGRADVMLDPEMNLWDVAALYPVITEAGGILTTWDGDSELGDSAVATNGLLHRSVLSRLGPH